MQKIVNAFLFNKREKSFLIYLKHSGSTSPSSHNVSFPGEFPSPCVTNIYIKFKLIYENI